MSTDNKNMITMTVTDFTIRPFFTYIVNDITEHRHQQGIEGKHTYQCYKKAEQVVMTFITTKTTCIHKQSYRLLPAHVTINDISQGKKSRKQDTTQKCKQV